MDSKNFNILLRVKNICNHSIFTPFPVPPKWTVKFPDQIEVPVGNSHELNCTASGVPTPTYEWYHNGTIIKNRLVDRWFPGFRFRFSAFSLEIPENLKDLEKSPEIGLYFFSASSTTFKRDVLAPFAANIYPDKVQYLGLTQHGLKVAWWMVLENDPAPY